MSKTVYVCKDGGSIIMITESVSVAEKWEETHPNYQSDTFDVVGEQDGKDIIDQIYSEE